MGNKLSSKSVVTAAVILTLPAGAMLAPAAAGAKSQPKHRAAHHHKRSGVRTVTFMAQVVKASAKGLIVRRSDGQLMSFSTEQILRSSLPKHHRHHRRGRMHDLNLTISSGNVVVNILGLQPGVMVQITETSDGSGQVTITIQLPPTPAASSASGVISELDGDAFTIQAADGSELRFAMPADRLSAANLQTCDTVDVSYHQDGGLLVADSVTATGQSTDGSCAPSYDVQGTITAVSDSSVTLNGDNGSVTIPVDPSSGLTDGYQVGDLVDVSYTQGSDGSMNATDICFVEEDATGQVSSVTTSLDGGSLTITDDSTGQPDTFQANSDGVQINSYAFNGVSLGDHVDVQYHQSAGQLIADTVSEQ
jgi:hypothetical protein